MVAAAPVELEEPSLGFAYDFETLWQCVVWDDPVNLMTYVTYVFVSYFGYSTSKAESLMLEVHNSGRAAVSSGTREQAERDVAAMHSYGLWATVEKAK